MKPAHKTALIAITAVAGLATTAIPASADRIDGDWCSATGKHLRIVGPRIMIPSGAEIAGEYGRHSFRYVGPEGDPEAGQTIDMQLLSEQEMWLQRIIGEETRPVETWLRCQAVS